MHAPEIHEALGAFNPVGRLGEATDIADAILFLDAAPFITGEICMSAVVRVPVTDMRDRGLSRDPAASGIDCSDVPRDLRRDAERPRDDRTNDAMRYRGAPSLATASLSAVRSPSSTTG